MTVITIACLIAALAVLFVLSIIDLKTRLLPNKYVAVFFILGLAFNISTKFLFSTPMDIFLGVIAGAGLLLAVRHIANKAYKHDTLGLGDVKLMGAAGMWLGLEYIFLSISIGAFAGLIHGVIYKIYMTKKTGKKINFAKLSIPAGPGFIVGIIIVAIIKFAGLVA